MCDIDAGHLPSADREPDRVTTLAASDVESATGAKRLCLSDQHRIRVAAPGEIRGRVAVFPVSAVECLIVMSDQSTVPDSSGANSSLA